MNAPQPTVAELWERWQAPLLRFLRQRVGDPHQAEDLLQEVFLRVHQRLASLHAPERSQSWLWQIARNVVIDAYRQRRPTAPLTDDLAAASDVADDTQTLRQLAPCLRPLMQRLPAADQVALERTAFDGVSQQDLSVTLGMSFSGLKARVQRARGRLKALLVACCAVVQDQAGRLSGYRQEGSGCGAGGCAASGRESFCGAGRLSQ